MAEIELVIADIPDATLATAMGNTITLDANAAGYGWFVEASPEADGEFFAPQSDVEDSAVRGIFNAGRMDLLTAMVHEIGHVLGYDHSHHSDDVMFASLAAGVRRQPSLAFQPFDENKEFSKSVEAVLAIAPSIGLPQIAPPSVAESKKFLLVQELDAIWSVDDLNSRVESLAENRASVRLEVSTTTAAQSDDEFFANLADEPSQEDEQDIALSDLTAELAQEPLDPLQRNSPFSVQARRASE